MQPTEIVRREKQRLTIAMRYRWWPWAVGTVLAGALLMLAYLRLAGTTGMNSDAAGIVLQASGMLHGNVLLHGWWCTDVSFITTELPEYTLVTKLAGLRPEVVYICAALTYTLLVLLAAFVARGRARGPEGVIRALLAAGIMLAPQPTGNTTVLLGSPDHTGTAVPVLVLLLLLDRAPDPRARARWYIPAGLAVALMTAALLAWVMVGDPLVEVIAVVPLALACGVRAVRISAVRGVQAWRGHVPDGARGETQAGGVSPEADRAAGDRSAADMSWRSVGYHLLLGVAALAAIPLAHWGNSLILRHGGYQLGAARYHQLPLETVIKDAPFVGRSFLVVFGADYTGVLGAGNVAFALIHLIGVAVVVAAVGFAVWRLLVPVRRARAGDLVADFLVLAVVINVAAFLAFIVPGDIYVAHEIGPVAALGAALAGRLLSGPLLRVRVARRVHGRRPSATAGAGQPWRWAAESGGIARSGRPSRVRQAGAAQLPHPRPGVRGRARGLRDAARHRRVVPAGTSVQRQPGHLAGPPSLAQRDGGLLGGVEHHCGIQRPGQPACHRNSRLEPAPGAGQVGNQRNPAESGHPQCRLRRRRAN